MLQIRHAQMEAFGQVSLRTFEQRCVEHLEAFFPRRCALLGQEEVRDSVQLAIRRAKRYRLKSEIDTMRYLNLMYVLGFDFDTDPRYSWARQILNDPARHPRSKTDGLVAKTHAMEAEKGFK